MGVERVIAEVEYHIDNKGGISGKSMRYPAGPTIEEIVRGLEIGRMYTRTAEKNGSEEASEFVDYLNGLIDQLKPDSG